MKYLLEKRVHNHWEVLRNEFGLNETFDTRDDACMYLARYLRRLGADATGVRINHGVKNPQWKLTGFEGLSRNSIYLEVVKVTCTVIE